ncbi:nuclear transport factor 2 family protein [Nocardia sp. NPDC006630]|uniref:nuclear transport factor 2 family protein n=1 Tax=Nocardia sp. NPDC006630 TaxID=3157181 RepID=UPI00339F5747
MTIVAYIDIDAAGARAEGEVVRTTSGVTVFVTEPHALSAPAADTAAMVRELRDRAEISDALYRFALGQDLRDKELFASSFTADAELDFQPAAVKWGGVAPLMTGRDFIVDTILGGFAGRVDTTHQVTNTRIAIQGDTARLTALVEAQHLLTADHGTFALLKNRYDVELVREGGRWLMSRVRIENAWFTGDPTEIF